MTVYKLKRNFDCALCGKPVYCRPIIDGYIISCGCGEIFKSSAMRSYFDGEEAAKIWTKIDAEEKWTLPQRKTECVMCGEAFETNLALEVLCVKCRLEGARKLAGCPCCISTVPISEIYLQSDRDLDKRLCRKHLKELFELM